MDRIQQADIVMSTNGREAGKLFVVLEVEARAVVLADGKHRRIESPKRKNQKHVRWVARPELETVEGLSNREIRKLLRETQNQA